MTFDHEVVDNFLKAVFPLPKNFGIIYSASEDIDDLPIDYIKIKKSVQKVDRNVNIFFGASKIVIISQKLNNIVIKIPFNGYFYGKEWHDFEWAAGSDPSDYCLTEYEKYTRLKTYNLSCFIAKTIYYKTIDHFRIFLQEYITPLSDLAEEDENLFNPSKTSKKIADKWFEKGKICISPKWIANCLDRYGKSKVERFLYYCNNLDLDILEDAHDSNLGYREDGTPCILDYSNFKD